ncbi:MAG: aminopeptidase P family protein [Armatimonadetes bacterium]|nr:aminopeptidase P family protein [Armatimonadota bacterium]
MTRLARLRGLLEEQSLPAVLITDMTDVAWLSGFRGSSGALLIGPAEQALVTDFRYFTQAAEQAPEWELVKMEPGERLLLKAGKTALDRGVKRLGFQADQLTYDAWEKLGEALEDAEVLAPTRGLVAGLREVKDPGEIELIRRAARLGDEVMQRGIAALREGLTERELKAELDYYMVSRGADEPAFHMIVASGPHSALPHSPITDRAFARGDMVTFDLGCRVAGYCSDLTRTVALGTPSEELQHVYRVVYEAQIASLAAIRPGVVGKDVDEVARAIIREAGFEEHFGHGLGHGVGLQIHEEPRLAVSGEKELVTGNVVTVEPGVYLPERGGVRIEDLVVVTEDGCELLSAAPKSAEVTVL